MALANVCLDLLDSPVILNISPNLWWLSRTNIKINGGKWREHINPVKYGVRANTDFVPEWKLVVAGWLSSEDARKAATVYRYQIVWYIVNNY